MIVGLGMDVVEVSRIRKAILRHGQRFLHHVFCDEELREEPDGEARHPYYAGRWAAKEAVAKALGTGIGEWCGWTDICIRRLEAGQPAVSLSGRAQETAASLGADSLHVTITHEKRLACAAVVAENRSVPRPPR